MTRVFLLGLGLTLCFCLGCTSNDAEFTPTDVATQEELDQAEEYAENYDKAMDPAAISKGEDPFAGTTVTPQ